MNIYSLPSSLQYQEIISGDLISDRYTKITVKLSPRPPVSHNKQIKYVKAYCIGAIANLIIEEVLDSRMC